MIVHSVITKVRLPYPYYEEKLSLIKMVNSRIRISFFFSGAEPWLVKFRYETDAREISFWKHSQRRGGQYRLVGVTWQDATILPHRSFITLSNLASEMSFVISVPVNTSSFNLTSDNRVLFWPRFDLLIGL